MLNKFFSNFATLFGLGQTFKAPGTVASLLTIILLAIAPYDYSYIILLSLLPISYISIHCYLKSINNTSDDPSEIVIDEVIGQMIAFLVICEYRYTTYFWPHVIMSFLLFRIFDILKPFPINWFDANIKGSFGIILDDILAGLLAAFTEGLIFRILKILLLSLVDCGCEQDH